MKTGCTIKFITLTEDIVAAVLLKLGNKTEARIITKKAIDIAKKNGQDSKETEALLKIINELK